jgi:hypothetical protein
VSEGHATAARLASYRRLLRARLAEPE